MQFKYKLTPCLVTMALAAMSGQVVAVPMHTASATYTVGGVGPTNDSQSSGLPGSVDVLRGDFANGSSIFYHTYGSVNPGVVYFGARASGGGTYDLVSPYALRDYQFVVPGAGPTPVFFHFVIDNGQLSVNCSPCTGGGLAQIDILMKVNNNTIEAGQGKLEVDANGIATLTHSGLADRLFAPSDPSGETTPGGSANYSWGATPITLFLGNYAGGSTISLDYDLIATAKGNFGTSSNGGNGYGCEFAFGECTIEQGGTAARSGDPLSQTTGQGFLARTGVPEPSGIALIGVGIAAALATRRRRPKRKS